MRRCLGLLLVLCLLPSGTASGGDHAFEERFLEGALGPMDLHGTRLAWAGARDGGVQLIVSDLTDGSELVATAFEAAGDQPVQSLSFDGRWIAWTDGRFGNLDAFAIDTETGRLLRLSDHSLDDRDVVVEDGRFAWVRGGIVRADDQGAAQVVPGSGTAFGPAFAGGWLVWSQIEDQRRVVRGQYLADGTVHTLADDEGILHKGLDGAADGHIVWMGVVDDEARIYVRLLRPDGTLGETRVLTDWGLNGGPRTGGGHGAWIEAGSVRVERLRDGRGATIDEHLLILASSDLLVLAEPDPQGGVHVRFLRWTDWDAVLPVEPRDPRPYLVAAGVAVLAGGAGLQWWKARRKTD